MVAVVVLHAWLQWLYWLQLPNTYVTAWLLIVKKVVHCLQPPPHSSVEYLWKKGVRSVVQELAITLLKYVFCTLSPSYTAELSVNYLQIILGNHSKKICDHLVRLTPGCNCSLLIGAIRKKYWKYVDLDTFYGVRIYTLVGIKNSNPQQCSSWITMLLILICVTIVFPLSTDSVNTSSIGL